MSVTLPDLSVRLAQSPEDQRAAQRLRHRVFVEELGAQGTGAALEHDRFDNGAEHLLLLDAQRPPEDRVVGTYRIRTGQSAEAFASAAEFDLAPLLTSGQNLMELSRSCLHKDYRDGRGMFLLWQALSDLAATRNIDLLFGVASFWETDLTRLAAPLSLLHAEYLAPREIRPSALHPAPFQTQTSKLDRKAVMKAIPALIKAYLRLGGVIGQGAFVDHAFGTTDVCMVVETGKISARQRAIYARSRT